MALKGIVVKLDDVDEKYRDLYTQKPDGKGGQHYVIQIEGVKTQADVDAVSTALRKERADHAETTAKLKTAGETIAAFGDDVTPEAVTALKEKLANLEAAGTPELTKNFEKIVSERVASQLDSKLKVETAKLQKTIGELQTLNGVVTKENETFKLNDQHRTIDDAVRAAATEAKLLPGAITDALIRARSQFELVDGKVQTKDGLVPADWVEARKQDAAHWWPVARGAGAQGSDGQGNMAAGDNPWSPTGWNVTKQGQIVMSDPQKAERLAASAGSKVGATAPTKA